MGLLSPSVLDVAECVIRDLGLKEGDGICDCVVKLSARCREAFGGRWIKQHLSNR
jgi:hypothetical protein